MMLETKSIEIKAGKPFPRFCDECRKKTVWPIRLPYSSQIRHDGVLHDVEIPELVVPRCGECGKLYFDNSAEEQISNALRGHLHLLTPDQIRLNRQALGLSELEIAVRLGLALNQLANWEEGLQIQSRAHDNLLRAFFALPEVRSAFGIDGINPAFGCEVGSDASRT